MVFRNSGQTGFTIMELMVATTVFSVVLLGALTGFIEIGKIFYKGVSTTNTQTVANQILQDVSGQFQSVATDFSKVLSCSPSCSQILPSTSSQGTAYSYYCIGNTRYTYNIATGGSHLVNFANTPNHLPGGNFGILKDILPGGTGCATPCTDDTSVSCASSSDVRFQNAVELLGDNMRLNAFYIDPSSSSSNLFNITIIVAYGQDYAFSAPTSVPAVCSNTSGIDQFCSVANLTTAVFRGWNQ